MILELRDVCKDYTRGKNLVPVLKNVNLQVEQGDYIAIMGPSGSGKTTLMNLVGCLDLPTSGQYILKDQDMSTLNDNQLAEIRNQHIGFVFQNFYLLPKMTALDNVALPLLYAGVSQKVRRETPRSFGFARAKYLTTSSLQSFWEKPRSCIPFWKSGGMTRRQESS